MSLLSSSSKPYVLIVDDDPDIVRILQAILKKMDVENEAASTGRKGLQMTTDNPPAALLLDMRLPDMDGMEILNHVVSLGMRAVIIVITAHGSVDLAVDAMRQGAYDFLTKPLDIKRVQVTVRNALERFQLLEELNDFRQGPGRTQFRALRGACPAMQRIFQTIQNTAPGDVPVVFMGEPGTGKQLCARVLHEESGRKAGPFLVMDCESAPPESHESLLWGAAGQAGLLEQSHGGTLYLREFHRLSPRIQTRLMRFMQTGAIENSSTGAEREIDVRLLGGTSRSPKAEIAEGRLVEALYYRMAVVTIPLPRLRDRGEDIILLAQGFLEEAAAQKGKKPLRMDSLIEAALLTYAWPGNVREARDVLLGIAQSEGAADAAAVEAWMLPPALADPALDAARQSLQRPAHMADLSSRKLVEPLWKIEREAIERALQLCEGSIPDAARLLEVSPGDIYRKQRIWKARQP